VTATLTAAGFLAGTTGFLAALEQGVITATLRGHLDSNQRGDTTRATTGVLARSSP
jgi:hypothetical protein